MSEDYLKLLPEKDVAAWYRRLADRVAQEKIGGQEPLAATFLRHWLDNNNPKSVFHFKPPDHLKQSTYVVSMLQFHRRVFLSEEKARFTGTKKDWFGKPIPIFKWAGVIPRLQGHSGFTKWDGNSALDLTYECLVEVGSSIQEIYRIMTSGTPEEKDLFTSLRGFHLRSKVNINGQRQKNNRDIFVTFISWTSRVEDRYDWDYGEHLTMPNPDFGSKQPGAVRPQDKTLTVYHSNAKRLEDAGLAAPYDVESDEWSVNDAKITGPATVDSTRKLN
jgi:hypothetical protein